MIQQPTQVVPARRSIVTIAIVSLTSCTTYMDTEYFERPEPERWEEVSAADRIDSLGIYSATPPDAISAGLGSLLGVDMEGVPPALVLGPLDKIDVASGVELESLKRRKDVRLQQVGKPTPVRVGTLIGSGRCEVVTYQVVRLAEQRMVQRFKRYPTAYKSLVSGQTYSAAEMDFLDIALGLPLLPLRILQLAGRFQPTKFEVELVGTFPSSDEVANTHSYLRPAPRTRCLWALEITGPDGPIELSGVVTTSASGRAVIPLWDCAKAIRDNIDFSTIAQFTATVPAAGDEAPKASVQLNLLQLNLEESL